MEGFARVFFKIGIAFLAIAAILWMLRSSPFLSKLGKLPGDIVVKRPSFSFYFPLTTCIFISILLSLILGFFNKR